MHWLERIVYYIICVGKVTFKMAFLPKYYTWRLRSELYRPVTNFGSIHLSFCSSSLEQRKVMTCWTCFRWWGSSWFLRRSKWPLPQLCETHWADLLVSRCLCTSACTESSDLSTTAAGDFLPVLQCADMQLDPGKMRTSSVATQDDDDCRGT